MADSEKDTPEIKPVTILGRTMNVQHPNAAQVTLIHRYGKVGTMATSRLEQLEKLNGEPDEAFEQDLRGQSLDSIGNILDIIENLVIDAFDREFLLDQMKAGKLDLPDLHVILEAFQNRETKRAKAKRVK